MPVNDIGPFQNIVGVGWDRGLPPPGTDYIIAYFKLTYYADSQRYACTGSPNYGFYISFANSVQLIPNYAALGHQGILTLINASGTVPFEDVTYSGIPDYPVSVPSPDTYDWRLDNHLDFYESATTVYGSDQIIETEPFAGTPVTTTTYETYDRGLLTTWICKNAPFDGAVFCDTSTGWYNRSTDVSIALPDRETIATAELDFSNFSLTHLPTGNFYAAYASRVLNDGIGENLLMVLCARAPVSA